MTSLPPDHDPARDRDAEPREQAEPSTPSPEPELPRWARRAQQQASGSPITEARLAAYVGAKWESTYRRKLAPFLEDPTFVPTWNWSAAVVQIMLPSAWFLYRKLYFPFAIFFLVPSIALRLLTDATVPNTMADLLKPENQWLLTMMGAVNLSSAIAAGGTANWFLFRRARAATVFVAHQDLEPAEDAALMQRLGGVNRMATALFVTMTLLLTLGSLGA
ncbi:MAG: hypothetical protein K2R93_21050 [Gemmatimonadaceae bacterium]|nr:hypothetical protein [Gemmatimonadaceae bacterium]